MTMLHTRIAYPKQDTKMPSQRDEGFRPDVMAATQETGFRAACFRSLTRERDSDQRLREWRAQTAIILGSGLNALVGEAAPRTHRPLFSEFAEIAQPSVPGHCRSVCFR